MICYGSSPQETLGSKIRMRKKPSKDVISGESHRGSRSYIIPQFVWPWMKGTGILCTTSPPPCTHPPHAAIGSGGQELNSQALWSLHRGFDSSTTTGSHRCWSLAAEPGEEGNGRTELEKRRQWQCWLHFHKSSLLITHLDPDYPRVI